MSCAAAWQSLEKSFPRILPSCNRVHILWYADKYGITFSTVASGVAQMLRWDLEPGSQEGRLRGKLEVKGALVT